MLNQYKLRETEDVTITSHLTVLGTGVTSACSIVWGLDSELPKSRLNQLLLSFLEL